MASDHAGFVLKEIIKNKLTKEKIKVIDLGPKTNMSVDYPDYAKKLQGMFLQKRLIWAY